MLKTKAFFGFQVAIVVAFFAYMGYSFCLALRENKRENYKKTSINKNKIKTEDMAKEIMLKIFELTNKGINVEFEENWGDGTITIYCGNNHTHCGYPDATDDELIKSVYETLVLGKGLSFNINLDEVRENEKTGILLGRSSNKPIILDTYVCGKGRKVIGMSK